MTTPLAPNKKSYRTATGYDQSIGDILNRENEGSIIPMFLTFYNVATTGPFVRVADLRGRRALRSLSTSRFVMPTFTRSTVGI